MTETYAIQRMRISGRLRSSSSMRLLLVRCLVLLLSFGLVSGNAHAALHLGGAPSEPCPEDHIHHTGTTSPPHQHQHNHGIACCCDCLGCTSAAYLPPELNVAPAELATQIHYDAPTASLSGRALVPEPG